MAVRCFDDAQQKSCVCTFPPYQGIADNMKPCEGPAGVYHLRPEDHRRFVGDILTCACVFYFADAEAGLVPDTHGKHAAKVTEAASRGWTQNCDRGSTRVKQHLSALNK